MKEENETRNNVMSLRRAETIAGKYLCNRCWKPLDVINIGQQKGYLICTNKQKDYATAAADLSPQQQLI